ncbi:MAG TPA: pilus assembly protein TadG-related protein [Candidatus Nanopelagicales bacterium]|nr:pilus assembly protein TadG-related protein [Candidatus Nanopelagicales bacterium]
MSGSRSDATTSVAQPPGGAGRRRLGVRGQVLVLFVFALGALFAILALVIDVGNIWNNSLHVQQAAEAAAMAGVPYMPGDFATASAKSNAEAQRNGFSSAGGATITPAINLESNRRLDVTISRPYGTYFLRLLGMNTVRVSRTATAEYTLPVPMGSPLSTYGDNSGFFWAAAEAQGTNRSAGDAYGTYYNPNPTLNNQYDARGYQYAIEVPPGAGATNVDLYDPTFCAVDDQKGTGDHWISWDASGWPAVSTYYTLWSDPAMTPLDYTDDVQVASSGTLFESKRQVDKSVALRENSASWPGHAIWSLPDCTSDAYHNQWWTLTTVTSPGTYRLQVTTTNLLNLNDQKGTSAENMWALRAVSTDPTYKPYVYGLGKMIIYANVANGTTLFYLGRIESVHAGKTMVIQLFDPGDASGNSSIEILQPTATGYTPASFSYKADANASGSKSGTNVASLRTTINGAGQYNNSWVTLTVPLPKTYSALLPPGEPAGTLGGWWKIRYTFDSTTTDTTTWQVSIRGNPVHLVLP